ncbi:integral peroxisomal membrane peroxin-domain-containing protein [Gorgonomyces haynaldii]|nr:integral peroxisomal membrane peroxin-domain-containing protein [Gorgonomyces haynaldii]
MTTKISDVTPPPSPGKAGVITELFAATQSEAVKLSEVLHHSTPPLAMTTMLKNNNRFVPRQKPFIWLNATLIKLVTWHNPANTLLFLACYIILCTNPFLIPVFPQLVLLYLIAKFYHYRAEAIISGKPLPEPHVPGTPPKIVMTNQEMVENLQQIQNTMGAVSDAYDAGYNLYKLLDWSTPEKTIQLAQFLLASMFGTWITLYFIRWNYVLLIGGVGLFVANTAVFKAASMTLTPALMETVQKRMDRARTALNVSRQAGDQVLTPVVVWAGAGFIPFLLSQERAPWTDDTGLIPMPPKDLYELPEIESEPGQPEQRWEWADEDWELDYKWAQVDDAGWQYTNNSWENPKSNRTVGAYTRRRKWVRHMKLESQMPRDFRELMELPAQTMEDLRDDDFVHSLESMEQEGPQVVVFEEKRPTIKRDKRLERQLKSSVIKKETQPTQQQKKEDKEDDQRDKELMELIKTSQLIEQYTDLVGKDRLKYQKKKLVQLGAQRERNQRAPLPIRMGMKRKAEERVENQIQEAKQTGMFTKSLKSRLEQSETLLQRKEKREKRDKGLTGSMGRIKDGVMNVSKKLIAKVQKKRR